MSSPVQQSPGSLVAHAWLRVLAWVLPGFTAPAILLLGFWTIYFSSPGLEGLVAIAVLVGAVLFVMTCGLLDAVLSLTRRVGFRQISARHLSLHTGFFFVMQLALTPLLGLATAFSCTSLFID